MHACVMASVHRCSCTEGVNTVTILRVRVRGRARVRVRGNLEEEQTG